MSSELTENTGTSEPGLRTGTTPVCLPPGLAMLWVELALWERLHKPLTTVA